MSKKKAKKKVAKKCSKKERQEPLNDETGKPLIEVLEDQLDGVPPIDLAEEKPRTIGTMGKPTNLDPDLVKRALGLGFTQNQVNGFTENGPLEAACDRCKPIPKTEAQKKPKRRPVNANTIPAGAKDHILELKAITTRQQHDRGRNRSAFDDSVINSAMFQIIKDNRGKYQVYKKAVEFTRFYEPDKAGNYVTEIRIVVGLDEL